MSSAREFARIELGDQLLLLGPAGSLSELSPRLRSTAGATHLLRRAARTPRGMRKLRAYWVRRNIGRPLHGLTDAKVVALTERAIERRQIDAAALLVHRRMEQVEVPVSVHAVRAVQGVFPPVTPSATAPSTTMSSRPDPAPSLWQRAVADVGAWPVEVRIVAVMYKAAASGRLTEDMRAQLRALITWQTVAWIAVGVALQYLPVTWLADAVFIGIAVYYGGPMAWQAGKDLGNCLWKIGTATSQADLDEAADYLARVVAVVTVVGLVALLHRVVVRKFPARGGGPVEEAPPEPQTSSSGGATSAPNTYRPPSEAGETPASDAAAAAKLKTRLAAEEISGGHAFEKHVLGTDNPAGPEFDDLGIKTQEQFADHIERVMSNPTAEGQLTNGRAYFYDAKTNTIVIRNPSAPDGGTAFRIDPNRYPDPNVYLRRLR